MIGSLRQGSGQAASRGSPQRSHPMDEQSSLRPGPARPRRSGRGRRRRGAHDRARACRVARRRQPARGRGGRYRFRPRRSFREVLSSTSSARRRFSLAFSSSSALSRRASEAPNPPYFAFRAKKVAHGSDQPSLHPPPARARWPRSAPRWTSMSMGSSGPAMGGQPLGSSGRVCRGRSTGRTVTPGPVVVLHHRSPAALHRRMGGRRAWLVGRGCPSPGCFPCTDRRSPHTLAVAVRAARQLCAGRLQTAVVRARGRWSASPR